MPLAAAIGVGGSLLGGIFGRNSQRKAEARQREYDKPINVRARYEEAGVNPLLAFQGGVVGQSAAVSAPNYLGAAFADAAAIAADGILRNSAAQKLERAERLNAKLSQDLTDATLRPKIPGVYAAGGSVAAASGGKNASVSGRRSDANAAAEPTDLAGGPATRYVVGGVTLEPNPNFSDAELIETRHGDAASWLYGIGTVGADLAYNKDKIGRAFGDAIGAVPIDSMPLKDRPLRWMRRVWGREPDGFDAGQPYWFKNGSKSSVTYIAPSGVRP